MLDPNCPRAGVRDDDCMLETTRGKGLLKLM
jgi:hypothetical protein